MKQSLICSTLRSEKVTSFDDISTTFIKGTVTSISGPLTHNFNLSLSSGVVPAELKIARVVPLFKTGDVINIIFSNYRPISVLPSFFKISEKLVCNRIIDYLSKYKILSDDQFGFRKQHSAKYALALLFGKISSVIDNNEITKGIFIDLYKAFHTVKDLILLDKLLYYGIRGVAFNWLEDYLNNRQHFVQFNGFNSPYSNIQCGVPQGSILGPLLSLIYITEMYDVSKVLYFILFADDTNIFFSHKNLNFIEKTLNEE